MNMKKHILNWMVPHRRGIMGTVIFHLLLAILFLSMEISKVTVHEEMEIVMDVPEPEQLQKQEQEERRKEEIRQKSSAEEVERMLRSIAVNENAQDHRDSRENRVREYVDEIRKELEEEGNGQYKVKRDKHYKQDSLQNAEDRREERLDSLKSTFYAGESSVSYNLKDRYARFLPIPVFKCENGGTVVVDIVVNQKGVVQKASVVKSQSGNDERLWEVAVDAAERSRFNAKPSAPEQQRGTITYRFVKQ